MIESVSGDTDKAPLNFLFIGIISIFFQTQKLYYVKKNRMDNLNSI